MLFGREASHPKEPVADNEDVHAKEISHCHALEHLFAELVRIGLHSTVMSSHKVCKLGYMVGLEPICESAFVNQIILTVNYLCAIIIEDNDAVEYITIDLDGPCANSRLNLPMQVHILLLSHFHYFFE